VTTFPSQYHSEYLVYFYFIVISDYIITSIFILVVIIVRNLNGIKWDIFLTLAKHIEEFQGVLVLVMFWPVKIYILLHP